MRNKNRVLSGLALLILTASAYAEDRVIEDSLIYKDPTVAKADQTIYGVSVDYFNMSSAVPSSSGVPSYTYNYVQPGLTGFAGKGNFTASVSYRAGTSDYSIPASANLSIPAQKNSEKTSDTEIYLRWLARDFATKYFTPYALIGYGQGNKDATYVLASGTYYSSITTTSTIAGIGAIIPVRASCKTIFQMRRANI
jgi:hypothetical protein